MIWWIAAACWFYIIGYYLMLIYMGLIAKQHGEKVDWVDSTIALIWPVVCTVALINYIMLKKIPDEQC